MICLTVPFYHTISCTIYQSSELQKFSSNQWFMNYSKCANFHLLLIAFYLLVVESLHTVDWASAMKHDRHESKCFAWIDLFVPRILINQPSLGFRQRRRIKSAVKWLIHFLYFIFMMAYGYVWYIISKMLEQWHTNLQFSIQQCVAQLFNLFLLFYSSFPFSVSFSKSQFSHWLTCTFVQLTEIRYQLKWNDWLY